MGGRVFPAPAFSDYANPYSILAASRSRWGGARYARVPGGEASKGSTVGSTAVATRREPYGPRGVGTTGEPSPKRRTHTQGRYCLIAQQSTQDEDQMDADPTQVLAQSSTTLISVMW